MDSATPMGHGTHVVPYNQGMYDGEWKRDYRSGFGKLTLAVDEWAEYERTQKGSNLILAFVLVYTCDDGTDGHVHLRYTPQPACT